MLTRDAAERFLKDPANGLKTPSSVSSYRYQLRRLVANGDREMDTWTEGALVDLCHTVTSKGDPPSDNTIRQRKAIARGFFEFAHWKGWISENPAAHINRAVRHGKQPVKRHHWLTKSQVAHVIESVDTSTIMGRRDQLIVRIGFTTGLRASELASMTWGTTDLDAGEVHIVGKGRKLATVALSGNTRLALIDWRSEAAVALGYLPEGDEGVIIQVQNASDLTKGLDPRYRIVKGLWDRSGVTSCTISKRVNTVSRACGIDFAAHDMRRTWAGLLKDGGASIYDVSKALRHSNVSVTERYLQARQDGSAAVSRQAGIDF